MQLAGALDLVELAFDFGDAFLDDAAVVAATGGEGADAVVLCAATPSSEPVNDAMRMTRRRGRVVVVGAVGLGVERADFYRKEIDLRMSCSYGPGRYDAAYEERGQDYPFGHVRWTERRNLAAFLSLVASGAVRPAPLVSGVFPIAEAPNAFERLVSGDPPAIGVVLDYGPPEGPEGAKLAARAAAPPPRLSFARGPAVRIALIGAGSFGQSVYLPLIADSSEASLRAVVAAHGHNAARLARLYHADYAAADIREALDDPQVDAVVIATRHHLHAEMAVAALQAGKHVLLEKPIALSREEARAVAEAARAAGVVCTVGHNRRYAPATLALRRALDTRQGPLAAVYRINAGPLPPDHWVHDPAQGGGRIVGEMCHFFDLMQGLVRRSARLVACRALPADGRAVRHRDNVATTLAFDDGSVAQLLYVAVGHAALAKERLELFWDGRAAVLDDFERLSVYGDPEAGWAGDQDKGQKEQFARFLQAVRGEPAELLTIGEALGAAELCFDAEDALSGRKSEDVGR